jgi:serine/threonine-protein kinase
MIGNIIGNYKIEQKLGEGGMGAVYKGVDMMLEREVAIKALRPELASQTQVVERFRSEAVTLAKLNHPNIATLYNFFRQGDEFYMVLEFVRGTTLDQIISERGAMPAEQAVPLFCKVLDGIDHAHEMGIVHRDIKPANMMLTDKGALKVLDFGIARILGTARMTKAGHLIGTIEYMAPEQVKGLETDARSDIYSLGMLLYEMLTGRVPFDIQNEFELMKAQIEQMPVPPRQINPGIPPEVEGAIMRAIAKDPIERYQTAGDFRAVLLSAGFASTGALNSVTADRNNPYATQRLSNPSLQTTPDIPRPSIPPAGDPLKETRIGTSPVSAPQQPPPHDPLKETRLGMPGAAAFAGAAPPAGAKETRLGTAAAVVPPHGYQQAGAPPQRQPAPAPSPSFFSKLKPVHYIGGGVAVLFILGVLIAFPLMLLSGSKNSDAPSGEPVATRPAPAAAEQPAPAAEQPAAPTSQQAGSQPSGVAGGDASTTLPSSEQSTVKSEAPLPAGGLKVGPAEKAPAKAASKPAAPSKPKTDAAAAEAKRRREAALRALDQ